MKGKISLRRTYAISVSPTNHCVTLVWRMTVGCSIDHIRTYHTNSKIVNLRTLVSLRIETKAFFSGEFVIFYFVCSPDLRRDIQDRQELINVTASLWQRLSSYPLLIFSADFVTPCIRDPRTTHLSCMHTCAHKCTRKIFAHWNERAST